MCGIAGILNKNSKVDKKILIKILKTMPWRGPDDEGIWLEKKIGLTHKRLSIFDLSKFGKQPMFSSDKRFVISFNGEIYNWPEIRSNLQFNKWKSKTDTETILESYREKGLRFLEDLNGMFSFSIWDRKKKELLLVRDRIGIKPLFYAKENNSFLFGSEIKAILGAGLKKEINYKTIHEFLCSGLIDHGEKTFFKGVKNLLPGHYMIVKSDLSFKIKSYWNLLNITKKDWNLTFDESREEYKFLLKNAVSLQTRSDVEVGISLSSGVDSQILALLSQQNLYNKKNLQSFTYRFDKNDVDYYGAKKLSSHLKIKNNLIELKHLEVPNLMNTVIKSNESPVTSIVVLGMHKMYQKVKERGIKVILDGSGGDECGAAYDSYYVLYLLDSLNTSNKSLDINKKLLARHELKNFFKFKKEHQKEKILFLNNSLKRFYNPGTATHDGIKFTNEENLNSEFVNSYKNVNLKYEYKSLVKSAQYNDLKYVLLPRVLRYLDRSSMASSIESRVPFLDHKLVELSFGIQTKYHISVYQNEFQNRILHKLSLDLKKFKDIRQHKKTIVDPQREWLQNQLRDWTYDILNSTRTKNSGIFNQKKILEDYENYRKEKNPKTSFHIFQYLNIITWLENFF